MYFVWPMITSSIFHTSFTDTTSLIKSLNIGKDAKQMPVEIKYAKKEKKSTRNDCRTYCFEG